MSVDDLSGEWRGIFNYPREAPPTEFVAILHEAGGALSGQTVEPSLWGGEVTARLDGRRSGKAVTLAKLYEESDGEYDSVAYQGSIDAEGLEITGTWSIPGIWSGTFIMVRERSIEQSAEQEADTDASTPEPASADPASSRAPTLG